MSGAQGGGARLDVVLDDTAAQAVLGQLRALAGDLTPLWQEVGDSLVTSTQMRFEAGRGPNGVPWKPSRRAQQEDGRTLIDSGILRTSINRVADADGVTIGTNIRYAAAHQFGATIRAKTSRGLRFRVGDRWITKRQVFLPPRPFLGVDDDDRAEILAIATDHLRAATDGAAT